MVRSASPIHATTTVAWAQAGAVNSHNYLIGLSYEGFNKVLKYAWLKKLFVPAVSAIIFLLGLGLLFSSALSIKLSRKNNALVAQVLQSNKETYLAEQELGQINKVREQLLRKILEFQTYTGSVEDN